MGSKCISGNHAPSSRITRNQGFEFAQCRHCACDLIRSNRRWKTVPEGFRVVWRGSDHGLSEDPSQLLLNLPPVGRALTVRGSGDQGLSHLGAIFALVAAGLAYLLWAAKDGVQAWWSRLSSRHQRRAVLKLPAR
jgi:hypothetical protein